MSVCATLITWPDHMIVWEWVRPAHSDTMLPIAATSLRDARNRHQRHTNVHIYVRSDWSGSRASKSVTVETRDLCQICRDADINKQSLWRLVPVVPKSRYVCPLLQIVTSSVCLSNVRLYEENTQDQSCWWSSLLIVMLLHSFIIHLFGCKRRKRDINVVLLLPLVTFTLLNPDQSVTRTTTGRRRANERKRRPRQTWISRPLFCFCSAGVSWRGWITVVGPAQDRTGLLPIIYIYTHHVHIYRFIYITDTTVIYTIFIYNIFIYTVYTTFKYTVYIMFIYTTSYILYIPLHIYHFIYTMNLIILVGENAY